MKKRAETKAEPQARRRRLDQLVRRLSCFFLGHKHSLSSQGEEMVRIHKIDGTTIMARALIERNYCGRCREEIGCHIVNNGPPPNPRADRTRHLVPGTVQPVVQCHNKE